jgi:hypothetical protein
MQNDGQAPHEEVLALIFPARQFAGMVDNTAPCLVFTPKLGAAFSAK